MKRSLFERAGPTYGPFYLAVSLALILSAGCDNDKHKGPVYIEYTLTVSVGTGVDGGPPTGIYHVPAGLTTSYGYRALEDFTNLVVRLDTTQIAPMDSFLMDKDHTLSATCDVRVLWRRHVDTPGYYCSPVIGADGTVYFASGMYLLSSGYLPGTLYALNPDGTSKWEYYLGKTFFSPAIGENGWIYVMDQDYRVYAFTPGGSLIWTFYDFDFPFVKRDMGQRTPAIGADGTVYVGGDGLYALEPDTGERKWHFRERPRQECMASPVIGEDNTIYVAIGEDTLYAVNPDSTRKWAFGFEHEDEMSFASPAIDAGGVIYEPTERYGESRLYAINPDGTLKWVYYVEEGRPVRASPAIAEDGTIYIATKAGGVDRRPRLIALSPAGDKIWEHVAMLADRLDYDIYSTPSVGADGVIYFGAESCILYAVNPDGTLGWQHTIFGLNWSGPAITADGTLYMGGIDNGDYGYYKGAFCAVATSSQGLARSPWPKFHHDNRNTGRFGAE